MTMTLGSADSGVADSYKQPIRYWSREIRMPDSGPDTLMWEARTHPGGQDDLLRWVEESAVPTLLSKCVDVATYLGGEDHVDFIAHTTGAAPRLPDPPEHLLLPSVRQWPFRRHAIHLR
jgi:hypothetical protein